MPIYEYRCQSCGHELEAIQKISDNPLTDCPKCGKNSLEKVISSTQFQLKGTGWYVTDFKNSGSKDQKQTTPSTEGTSAKGSDEKSSPPSTPDKGQ